MNYRKLKSDDQHRIIAHSGFMDKVTDWHLAINHTLQSEYETAGSSERFYVIVSKLLRHELGLFFLFFLRCHIRGRPGVVDSSVTQLWLGAALLHKCTAS